MIKIKSHHHHVKSFNKAFSTGILLNILFVITEFYFGLKVNSLALIADAGHNLGDVAGLILAWVGLSLSKRDKDSKHSYGWKKASILAAFINALILLVAMGSLMWEAFGRIHSSQSADPETIMIVAFIGILVNSASAYLFFSGSKNDLNIRGAFLHMAADALVSLGVVLAGFLSLKFSRNWIDPVTGILISLIVIIGTAKLFFQSLHLLFDGVPDSVDFEEVKKYLLSVDGVTMVSDLHIWAMSTTEIALTAHLQMPKGSCEDAFLTNLAKELQERFSIEHSTIQIDQLHKNGLNC